MERIEATVTGKVQMVMFRDFTQRKAKSLGLVGEVQNCSDGSVCVIAEGERKQLEKLLKKLHTGPLLARVAEVKSEWLPATHEFTTFSLISGKK
jgi:acylphosphatase